MHTNDPSAAQAVPNDADDGSEAMDSGTRVAELEAALLAVRDAQLRERAELENQRKRLVRDVEQARKFANERLLNELLPVMDSLERGLEAASTETGPLRDGMELTLRQLRKVSEDNGLEIVDPVGKPFNPEHHQAMSMVSANDQPEDTVVQVMQKGYLLNGRLLRPALVVISK
jgi:molecular chaperone GrpE